ncbi:hypothetical protein [Haloferula sargassicola]|uniref:Uncharacterized protein n=1 Tax=Haloferula sargassicola TaxID=490096 RepID=A0ABP9UXC6_9BACT
MTKKNEKNPETKARLICPLQSTGRVGKSTACEAVLSWAKWAEVDCVAIDADDEHRTLSQKFGDAQLMAEVAREASAFKELIEAVAAAPAPLMVADFPAQATAFLLEQIEALRVLDVLDEAGVRMTVMLFPADDDSAQRSLAAAVRQLGTRVDYLLVRSPARYRTDQFDRSKAAGKLAGYGAEEIYLPVVTRSTLEEVASASRAAGRMLPWAEAAPALATASRFELEAWTNKVRAQCEEVMRILVPDPDLVKRRVERAEVAGSRDIREKVLHGKDGLDPLDF